MTVGRPTWGDRRGEAATEAETVRERGAREWCAAACERESESEK